MKRFDPFAHSAIDETDERVLPQTAPQNPSEASPASWPLLPWPRGPLSAAIITSLQDESKRLGSPADDDVQDPLRDDDFQLALYLCYEVHHRNVTRWDEQWNLDLWTFRTHLETIFTTRLRQEVLPRFHRLPFDVASEIDQLIFAAQRISISSYFVNNGDLDQFREFCVHQSISQLRAGDFTTLAVSRLSGEARAALIEIDSGNSFSDSAHKSPGQLFAATMSSLGLDPSYGSYVEMLPAVTLATINLTSMFALHPVWRAELVGHLAFSEMTSVGPMERYGQTLKRFGVGSDGREFYESQVTLGDQRAEIARGRLVTGLLMMNPDRPEDVIFGAAATLLLEENFTRHLLESWLHQRSSLVPWEMNS